MYGRYYIYDPTSSNKSLLSVLIITPSGGFSTYLTPRVVSRDGASAYWSSTTRFNTTPGRCTMEPT